MKVFVVAFLCVTVASASWVAPIVLKPVIPSGSVAVGVNGAVVAGPAGSVATDNGLGGHGAGARLSGPAGDVRTQGGSVALSGPGNGQGGWDGNDGLWGGDDGRWDDGRWDNDGWDGDDGQWRGDGRVGIVVPTIGGWGWKKGW